MARALTLSVSFALAFGAGFIGAFFTAPAIDSWYAFLEKPSFSPPNWVFGPVWTLLYAMMAVAAWRVWHRRDRDRLVKLVAPTLYLVQLVLNALWSIAFFGFRSPTTGFVVICLLFNAIVGLTVVFARVDRPAALLMVPYVAWVTFAAALNFMIILLN